MSKRKKKPNKTSPNPSASGPNAFAAIKALYQKGQLAEALIRVRVAVERPSDDLDLLNLAGLLELQVGNPDVAIKWLTLVHEKVPDNPDISDNLGNAYCAAGRYDEGADQFDSLLQRAPQRLQTWCNLGNARSKRGDLAGAQEAYLKALAKEPNYIPALTNLALLDAQSGNRAKAIDRYHQILLQHPTDGEIYSDLSRLKKFKSGDPDITKMEKLTTSSFVSDPDRMYLGYALGKAYEDIGEFDKSFEQLNIGNSLKRAITPFHMDEVTASVDQIIETFSADLFKENPVSNLHKNPIFIIGMPRSGTTLVEQIIASHSQVTGGGELAYLRDVITGQGESEVSVAQLSGTGEGYPAGVPGISASGFAEIRDSYFKLSTRLTNGAEIFTDKMPRNFLYAGFIKLAFPNAKVIHCRRSALDTCLSCYSIHFPYGQAFSNDLGELGQYYRAYDRLMAHWKATLGDWILDVSYEDMVANPKRGTQDLLNFCELPWEDGCLEFHKTDRQVTTASSAQVRQPIYKTAVKRWRRFESHLEPLIAALGPLADMDGHQ